MTATVAGRFGGDPGDHAGVIGYTAVCHVIMHVAGGR
jgi:hypothetical protein